jgi:hypothetical protein
MLQHIVQSSPISIWFLNFFLSSLVNTRLFLFLASAASNRCKTVKTAFLCELAVSAVIFPLSVRRYSCGFPAARLCRCAILENGHQRSGADLITSI